MCVCCNSLFAAEPVAPQLLGVREQFVVDSLFLEALRLKYLDNSEEEALNCLLELVKIDSTSAVAWYELSQYYSHVGLDDDQVALLEKAVSYQPDNEIYKASLAELLYATKQAARATPLYQELAKKHPYKPEYYYYLCRCYAIQGEFTRAIEALDTFESSSGKSEGLSEQRYQLYQINGEYLLSQGKIDEAKAQYEVLKQLVPEDIVAWMHLLQIAIKQGDRTELVALCDGALVYFPDVAEFYFYKGVSNLIDNNSKAAFKIFTAGLAVVNEKDKLLKSNFLEQIADIYYQQGNKKKAFEAFDQALENNPYNVSTLNNYAYYLALLKQDLDKAERMASEVIRQQPDNATYIDTYAWVLFQKGNYNLAKFYMESAISKSREPSGDLHEHYGDILQATGNPSGAVLEWQKALALKSAVKEDVKDLKKKIKKAAQTK
ncbi:hypothetical protein AGMMS49965_16620 [Bacteroidia bacterium]|nr:hypothetical protein AGMMS49965_16620 [Bacteroidia bacterium]